MNQLPQFIAIEGVDGVGKTTLAQRFAAEHGYQYRYTLPLPLKTIRQDIEDFGNYDIRFFYYLSCVIAFQRELEELLRRGSRVVVDRYVYSTFSMHRAMGVAVDCVNRHKLPIRMPDCTILLTCDSSVRNDRLIRRDENGKMYVRSQGKMLDTAQNNFRRKVGPAWTVDTTLLSADEVFSAATQLIGTMEG